MAFRITKTRHPFTIDAFVLLPERSVTRFVTPFLTFCKLLRCLNVSVRVVNPDQPSDKDYSMRWNAIKGHLSRYCPDKYKPTSVAQKHKWAQTVWQPRFWEHQIRDERDFKKHCDYIHWNPVKHGLVSRVRDWPYSIFHRFVRNEIYTLDWAGTPENCADFSEMNMGNNGHLLIRKKKVVQMIAINYY